MEFGPIFRAMLRNKPGFVLIGLQIAFTMAIMTNAIAIIQERSELMARPSGVDESNVFYLTSLTFDPEVDRRVLIDEDLRALRAMPGVVNAISTNSVPLRGGGWSMGLQTEPGAAIDASGVAIYFADENGVDTFGTNLVAGRDFRVDDIRWNEPEMTTWPTTGIITEAMATALYPDEDPADSVGRTVYINTDNPIQIVGVIDRLQAPWSGWDGLERSMLVPEKREWDTNRYVVRTEPGQLNSVMAAAEDLLVANSAGRIVRDVTTMAETRERSYRDSTAMVGMLTFTVTLLTVITALGIVGLASFSVSRRTKQIGTRRALGASRGAILRYFMVENLVISTVGVVLGGILAVTLNVWMVDAFEMAPMRWYLVPAAMLTLWAVGLIAVAGPARRASRVSPAIATRTV